MVFNTESNLDCFLHCTTPTVKSQFLPKSEIRNLNRLWHPWEREEVEYFTLSHLWNCYDEWSAYGAGVPILLNHNTETLVQYYVPYLSAIQIFTSLREEKESGDAERDWFSESSSDGWSSEDGGWSEQDRLGYLYFQYLERSTPYGRVPLMDKINGLSGRYPGLMSLRSVDLSPASWMAVSWYPIYHIPMGRTIKDLSTCFLTYHTLSSSFQDMDPEGGAQRMRKDISVQACAERKKKGISVQACAERKKKGISVQACAERKKKGISVQAFGLATYKMQGEVWVSSKSGQDQEKLVSLLNVADSWLKQLRVKHHDFNYFTGIRRG